MKHGRILLIIAGWAGLAAWVSIVAYVRATNRWGAFAVAPLLLPMFVLSAAVAGLGIVVCLAALRHRRLDVPVAVVAALHGAIVWYGVTQR